MYKVKCEYCKIKKDNHARYCPKINYYEYMCDLLRKKLNTKKWEKDKCDTILREINLLERCEYMIKEIKYKVNI